MNKNLIKEHLRKNFVSEADTPGISVTEKAKKESGKINKQGLKDYAKVVEKDAKKEDKEMSKNKFNYTDKFQKTYHDEMEIMNGQEMLQYDMKPSEEFKKKAKEGIEGSSKMGNESGVGNAEAAWEASSDKFGKDFIKRVKSSTKKRSEETPTLNLRGRDIQADMKDTGHKPYAIEESVNEMATLKKPISEKNVMVLTNWVTNLGAKEAAIKLINQLSQTGLVSDLPDTMEYGNGLNKVTSLLQKGDYNNAFHTAKTLANKLEKKAMKDMMGETKSKAAVAVDENKDTGVDKNYTHFFVFKKNGKIVDGFDYSDTDTESMKMYAKMDLKDNDYYPSAKHPINSAKDFSLISGKRLQKQGIDPYDWKNWYTGRERENDGEDTMMGESEEKEQYITNFAAGSPEEAEFRKRYKKQDDILNRNVQYLKDKKAKEDKTKNFNDGEDYEKLSREVEYGINNNDNKPKIKESMKRLKFKTNFNGLGNALKLIPESYKTNNKVFEMTDGNESYKIRWEGTLNEGKAVVLMASDKTLVNEDINRMKALFGYKSQDTLGLVKGNARIDENKTFGNMLNKMKQLINEGDDMIETEVSKPKEGNWDEQKKKAPEATKHISTAKGKSTTGKATEKNWDETSGGEKMMEIEAPKAKESNPDKAKKQAPEATKHISTAKGSTTKVVEKNWDEISGGEKMMEIEASTPKEGHWEDNPPSQAPEAKKHVHLKETYMGEEDEYELDTDDLENTKSNDVAYKKAFDSMGEEEGEEETPETDNWSKSDDEDSSDESEPTSNEFGDIPTDDSEDDLEDEIVIPKPTSKGGYTLLSSPSTGLYFIKGPGLPLEGMKVPDEFLSIASDKSIKGSERAAMIARKLEDMSDEQPFEDEDTM